MSDTLISRQSGISLVEALFALVLLALTASALGRYQAHLNHSMAAQRTFLLLWRLADQHVAQPKLTSPPGWQARLMESAEYGCTRHQVFITSPEGRQGSLSRLQCPLAP